MTSPADPPLEAVVPQARPAAPPRYLGRQLIAELYDCDAARLTDRELIERAMNDAAREAGATIVDSVFHLFNPHGVSGVVIIAESHLTIHTWPEFGYAAIDVFTCGETIDPAEAVDRLAIALGAGHHSVTEVNRGFTRNLKRG